jgi:hypothetical protein
VLEEGRVLTGRTHVLNPPPPVATTLWAMCNHLAPGNAAQQASLFTRTIPKAVPVFDKMEDDTAHATNATLRVLQACELFDFTLVAASTPLAISHSPSRSLGATSAYLCKFATTNG